MKQAGKQRLRGIEIGRLMVVGLLTLVVLGCGREAGTGTLVPDVLFLERDTNSDGLLTRAEARLPDPSFDELDSNQDAALSLLEWQGGVNDAGTGYQMQVTNETQRDMTRPTRTGVEGRQAD